MTEAPAAGASGPDLLDPLTSLLGKCRKARERVAVGTWQRRMLDESVQALDLAVTLLSGPGKDLPPPAEAGKAASTLAALTAKAEAAQARFRPGTAHHALQANRIRALEVARERLTRPRA